MTRVLRVAGWSFIGAGLLVLLYLVYSLYWTGITTAQAQSELLEDWELRVGAVDGSRVTEAAADAPDAAEVGAVDAGGALAVLQFVRPGSEQPPVTGEPLVVVDGVGDAELAQGPGRYPGSALPGEAGNLAIAGHRSTHGAPFYDLDRLQPGDEVHVTDRAGRRWVYRVVQQRIVAPDAVEVLGPDPLGTGRPTLTLTTCHPRFSNAERLIVHAELV